VLTHQVEPESRNGRLDAAVTLPAETSSASGTTLSVWKEEHLMLMRIRVWLSRGGRGIAGGEHQIVKSVQNKVNPAAIHRKTPERESVLRRNLPEAHDAGSLYFAMAVQRLHKLLESSPKAPRIKPTTA
jgi:hypothetical protein